MLRKYFIIAVFQIAFIAQIAWAAKNSSLLSAQVLDGDMGGAIACRVYIQGEDGKWYFPRSASDKGSAFVYQKQNWANKNSVEMHTTLSAHGFEIELLPGKYTVTIERGKEYFPQTRSVVMQGEPVELKIRLKRWVNMAKLGWYSGDTHVHRTLEELPNVQMAEDLNVSFPLLYWVTKAYMPPGTGDKSTVRKESAEVISIDDTHVIYPRNTEYEIFSVNGKRHTLGAVFILNHKSIFQKGTPPVAPIAEIAKQEGALLELDKHNWPWSMMLVPVMGVDLFELSNNHVWRTEFAFSKFGLAPPDYMKIETDEKGFTERGWIEYGFENYYALLNCGFDMRPTAGTASGVHPVPLGFGRVYVRLKEGFDYEQWMQGLNEGRSFVTTGPMLFVTVDGFDPGHTFKQKNKREKTYKIAGTAHSPHPLERIEIIVNAEVTKTIKPQNKLIPNGAYLSTINHNQRIKSTSWIAVRCFENRPDKRTRFAHTACFNIEVEGRPLRPRKEQIAFLIKRMEEQITRNKAVLGEQELEEYHKALRIYKTIAKTAQ